MPPEERDLLCGGWGWDPVLRELRHYPGAGKKRSAEPDGVERLRPVRAVTWHRWSQARMQSATGQAMPGRLSRIVVAYEGGGDLTINENDRECAEKLARAIAEAFGLAVSEEGAPGGRRRGTVPAPDEMGRLVYRSRRSEVLLDEVAGEVVERRRRFPFGTSRRRLSLRDVRRLELQYAVKGPLESFTLWAVTGEGERPEGGASGRLPVAGYEGYEGWADPEEWREFAEALGRRLGVSVSRAP